MSVIVPAEGKADSLTRLIAGFLLVGLVCCEKEEVRPKAQKEDGVVSRSADMSPTADQAASSEGRNFHFESSSQPEAGKPDRPWAGLHVHHRGAALDSAERAIVLLHGYGAPGDDLVDLAPRLVGGTPTALLFPEAPIQLSGGGRAWFHRDRSDFEKGYARMKRFFAFLRENHPELPLVLGGFSQGAILTVNLLIDEPEGLIGALIWSPADFIRHQPGPETTRFPLLVSHGRVDRVLPFEGGKRVAKKLAGWRYPVRWVPFHGPHSVPREVIAESKTFLDSL